jgi:branched-chain amino acid transport system substrate-binding protein
MGFQPSYQTEGRIYAQYLMQAHRDGKVAVLYQNDEYGKDMLKGLKDGLRGKLPIVAEVPYATTDTSLNSQISKLKSSGADILADAATPKFAAMAIRRVGEIGWIHIINSVSNSVGSVLTPAGLDNSEGALSTSYLKDPNDAVWKDDPINHDFLALMDSYYPSGDKGNTLSVYGYVIAEAMIEVLKQCGDDLSRENIMRQAANLKGLQLRMLLPGVAVNTSAADYAPLEQMQMMRFVRSDTLDYLEANGYANNVKNQLGYLLRLYNEEMHVVAPRPIHQLSDLDGKTVAVGLPDGGTFVTSINVFDKLHIKPHFLFIEQRVALERLRKG